MLTHKELAEILQDGESSTVEFKTDEVSPISLAEEMIAFANFKGGLLVLGVNDSGIIEGVQKDRFEEFIINVSRNNIRPPILPDIQKMRMNDKFIYLVNISQGDVPHASNKGQYFIRVGSTKQTPTHSELLRLFQRKNLLHFDELPVQGTSYKDISIQKVNKYVHRLGQSEMPVEEAIMISQMKAMRIVSASTEGDQNNATIAGLLSFGNNVGTHFPSYEIRCGAYRGVAVTDPVVQEKNCDGCLDQQIEDAIAFLKFHIPQNQKMIGAKRADEWIIPIDAIREAVVNAVCHRDYSIEGSAIRIFVFNNKVEIHSPGGLSNSLSLEELPYQQNNRNQAIASFLSGWGYAEKRGKGILMMQKLASSSDIKFSYRLQNNNTSFVVSFEWEQFQQ
jgi:ATP-dependent DNA helicase RecG